MGIGLDQPSHWLIIAVLAMLLFGYKKMPDMARSAGRSLRIFKTEMKGMADDDDARTAEKAATPDAPAAIAAVPVVAPAPVSTATASTDFVVPTSAAKVQVPANGSSPAAPPAG